MDCQRQMLLGMLFQIRLCLTSWNVFEMLQTFLLSFIDVSSCLKLWHFLNTLDYRDWIVFIFTYWDLIIGMFMQLAAATAANGINRLITGGVEHFTKLLSPIAVATAPPVAKR